MWFSIFVLFTALTISAVAAWYSIIGLTAIFAAAFWPIVIMGGTLEVGKIVTTVWLKRHWHQANLWLKGYLLIAVTLLMLITSMGIFGFLSKAHMDQTISSGGVTDQVIFLDDKIKTQRETIAANRKALTQMDAQVDARLTRSDDEKGAERAVQIRRSQARERQALQTEINAAQRELTKLADERAIFAKEVRKVEAEVGPIKYVAALIYGDNPNNDLLERAVRWVIILLVLVFDPLALALVLAANTSMTSVPQEVSNAKAKDDDTAPPVPRPVEADPRDAEIERLNRELAFERQVVDSLAEKFHEDAPEEVRPDEGLKSTVPPSESELPELPESNSMINFGVNFPDNPSKGDRYLTISQLPSKLHKFNGYKWIEVDKTKTDSYLSHAGYIDFLVTKLKSGEVEIDDLTSGEQDAVANYINSQDNNASS